MTLCSPPSRRGLAAVKNEVKFEKRPALTASARSIAPCWQVGTKKRSSVEQRNDNDRSSKRGLFQL
jgi:hypothetical protein